MFWGNSYENLSQNSVDKKHSTYTFRWFVILTLNVRIFFVFCDVFNRLRKVFLKYQKKSLGLNLKEYGCEIFTQGKRCN
jgi:hypothetical protein